MPTHVSNWSMHSPSSRHGGRKTECLWYSFLGYHVYSWCFRTPIHNPTMSQSRNTNGSWGDPSLVSLKWTSQCPKAKTWAGPEETRLPVFLNRVPQRPKAEAPVGPEETRLPSAATGSQVLRQSVILPLPFFHPLSKKAQFYEAIQVERKQLYDNLKVLPLVLLAKTVKSSTTTFWWFMGWLKFLLWICT